MPSLLLLFSRQCNEHSYFAKGISFILVITRGAFFFCTHEQWPIAVWIFFLLPILDTDQHCLVIDKHEGKTNKQQQKTTTTKKSKTTATNIGKKDLVCTENSGTHREDSATSAGLRTSEHS